MRATINKYTKTDVTLKMSGDEAKRIFRELHSANIEYNKLRDKGHFKHYRLYSDLMSVGNKIGEALKEADENIIPVDDFDNAAFKYHYEEGEDG